MDEGQEKDLMRPVHERIEAPIREIKGSYQDLNKVIELCRVWLGQDMDLLAGISAFKGLGKSTLTLGFLKRWIELILKRNMIPSEDLVKYIIYDNDELYVKPYEVEPYSVIICDEAVRFAMGEDWNLSENRQIKKLITQIRTKHLVIFFNIPDFFWLDRKYRETLSTFRINIIARGSGVMYLPDLRDGIPDRWHKKYFKDKVKPYNYFTPPNEVLKSLRRHPCYYMDFSFPPCPKNIYDQYLKIRDSRVFQEDNRRKSIVTMVSKAFMYNCRQKNPKYWTYKRLSDRTAHPVSGDNMISPPSVLKYVKEIEKMRERFSK